jgi:Inhibitor of sigma-G Gin.
VNGDRQPCIVCGLVHPEGITVWRAFICRQCERELVRTDVHDKRYRFFVQRMRRILCKKDA